MFRSVRVGREVIDYELIQTARKSIEMRVTGDLTRVFAPRGVRLRTVDLFVTERADWLKEAREKMRAAMIGRATLESGAQVLYMGIPLTLMVESGRSKRVFIEGQTLRVQTRDAGSEAVREAVREFLIDRARAVICERLDHFIPLIGRAPGRITIREQKTRWGSCSSKHNLNFNWKLIMAPPGALDYVVVHELVHLYEFNHSMRFWDMVERHLPDYKDSKQWLKQNGRMLGI